MYACFNYFRSVKKISADVAEEIYVTTSPRSKLRRFCADMIAAEGPLSDDFFCPLEIENWRTLIKKGSDLVLDRVETGSFKEVSSDKPYYYYSHAKYIDIWEKLS
jgi:hypothetical protein